MGKTEKGSGRDNRGRSVGERGNGEQMPEIRMWILGVCSEEPTVGRDFQPGLRSVGRKFTGL